MVQTSSTRRTSPRGAAPGEQPTRLGTEIEAPEQAVGPGAGCRGHAVHLGRPVREGRRGQAPQQGLPPAGLALLDARQQQGAQGRPPPVVVPQGVAQVPVGGLGAVSIGMHEGAAGTAALGQGQQAAPAPLAEPRLRAGADGAEAAPAGQEAGSRLRQAPEDRSGKHGAS